MTYDKELAREIFRAAILEAMDEAATRIFGESAAKARGGIGATDADLPQLFKALDAHLDRLSERFNHPLWEGYIGSPEYMAERAELAALGLPLVDDEALHS